MTETGMSLGTPHYMSPEQAMGEREIAARSDVYALGAVLYEMLTGEPPFTGATAQAVVARVLTESPRPLMTAAAHDPAACRSGGADRAGEAAGRPVRDGGRVRRRTQGQVVCDPTVSLPAAEGPAAPTLAKGRRRPGVLVPALGAALAVAVAAAFWGWLRPAPTPLLTQFSLGLRPPRRCSHRCRRAGGGSRSLPTAERWCTAAPPMAGAGSGSGELDQLDATPVAGTEGGSSPFFSSDGQRIGFIKSGTEVRIASLAGARP